MSEHEDRLTHPSGKTQEPAALRAADVLRFLHQHPAFFSQYPEMLAQMTVVDGQGSVTNLLNYQVKVLQDKNRQLKAQMESMLRTARHSEYLVNKVFDLALALVSRAKHRSGVNVFVEQIKKHFPCDFLALALPPEKMPGDTRMQHIVLISDEAEYRQCFADVLEHVQPVCGRIKIDKRQYLFGEAAEQVNSVALVPLGPEYSDGLLAFGSRDQQRFVPGMSTDVLQKLARLLHGLLLSDQTHSDRRRQADTERVHR